MILHNECLIEEDILDGIERVFLQKTEGLDEKGGQQRCEDCGLCHRLSQLHRIFLKLRWAYEEEDDIEDIPPLLLAFAVFYPSNFEVVLPGRFGLVRWIWEWSDLFAVGYTRDLLGDGLAAKKESVGLWDGWYVEHTRCILLRTTSRRIWQRHCCGRRARWLRWGTR